MKMTKQQQRRLIASNTTTGGPNLNGATMLQKIALKNLTNPPAPEYVVLMKWDNEYVTASWREGRPAWDNGHYFRIDEFAEAVADLEKRALAWLTA
jgi:hypothetical protein